MGIKKFAKQMFKVAMKDSFSYIISIAVTVMLVFVMVNISFNEVIYGGKADEIILVWRIVGLIPKQIPTTIGALQGELILGGLVIVTVFTVVSNNSFLNRRLKELSFIVMNGATIGEMSKYIRYMCSRIFMIASILGIILGIIGAPIFNFLMYQLTGTTGNLFLYYKDTFVIICGFALVNYMYLMIASAAYVYRKSVDELITNNNAKTQKDNRQFKIPNILYLVVYLLPFVIVFLPKSFGDISGFITTGLYIMAVASLGVIVLYIPEKLIKINRSKFMYDSERKIYINNSFIKLKNTIIYVVGMVLAINYFLDKMLEFKEHDSVVSILMFSMLLCTIIIAVSLTNKVIDDCGINKEFYKSLSAMGYSKEALFKISLKETRLTTIGVFSFIFPPLAFAVIMHIKNGSLEFTKLMSLAIIILLPILMSGVISYLVNKSRISKILGVKIENGVVIERFEKVFRGNMYGNQEVFKADVQQDSKE